MAHILLREQATKLRLKGYTFGQIKRELGIAKATLSNWLSKLPLTEEQLLLLDKNKLSSRDIAVEKFRNTYKEKRLVRLKKIYCEQEKMLPLSEKELFIAGLFLYWGEGEKKLGRVSVSNTDPKIIKFTLIWMTQALRIPKEKIKAALHLYKDMDIEESTNFWVDVLDFSKMQFTKPYIKNTNREGLTYKGFGHGTCKIYHHNVELSQKIAMSIKTISDFYGEKDEIFWYN